MKVERQKAIPFIYENVNLDCGFRADLVVEGRVVIETTAKTHCTRLTTPNCSPIFAC